jgi:hypothetical protein
MPQNNLSRFAKRKAATARRTAGKERSFFRSLENLDLLIRDINDAEAAVILQSKQFDTVALFEP